EREFWFTRTFFRHVRRNIARGRVALAAGGKTRHSFIAINDVAEYLVRAIDMPFARNRTFDVGGPEPLSSVDVIKIFEELSGKSIRVSSTPPFVFRMIGTAIAPISPAAANIMALNYYAATKDGIVPRAVETAAQFGFRLTTAAEFLQQKMCSERGRL